MQGLNLAKALANVSAEWQAGAPVREELRAADAAAPPAAIIGQAPLPQFTHRSVKRPAPRDSAAENVRRQWLGLERGRLTASVEASLRALQLRHLVPIKEGRKLVRMRNIGTPGGKLPEFFHVAREVTPAKGVGEAVPLARSSRKPPSVVTTILQDRDAVAYLKARAKQHRAVLKATGQTLKARSDIFGRCLKRRNAIVRNNRLTKAPTERVKHQSPAQKRRAGSKRA